MDWIAGLKISQLGMRAFQQVGQYLKPTTRFVQAFGKMATKSLFQVELPILQKIADGEAIIVDLGIENGYIILLYDDVPLGIGFYINGAVINHFLSNF